MGIQNSFQQINKSENIQVNIQNSTLFVTQTIQCLMHSSYHECKPSSDELPKNNL